MIEMASQINESCPFMIDNDTQLDNTIAFPDAIFQYNYTLVTMEKSKVDVDALTTYLKPGIVEGVRTSPEMESIREKRFTINYNYRDKNGSFLFKIAVTPEQYD